MFASADIIFSLGVCLEKAGKSSQAIEEYFKIIYDFLPEDNRPGREDLSRYKVKAYFRIARIHEKENKVEEAKIVYQKLIDLEVKESKIAKARLEELSPRAK